MNKNKLIWIAIVVAAVAAAFVLGRRSAPDHAAARVGPEAPTGAAEPKEAGAEVDVWTCSMHPQVRQPEFGSCPICGMDLIPVAADDDPAEDGDLPRLSVSERSAALMRVQTSPVVRREVEAELRFLGRLEADETLLRDVVVRSDSYVEKLHANYQWKMVRQGEPLAELYSPEVAAAARELLAAARGTPAGDSDRHIDSARARLLRMGVSPGQIEEILESREAPRTYEILSPKSGHVMNLGGREGDWLAEGRRLILIMDPSNLWVELEAYERDLIWLRMGLPVEFSIEAFPGEEFEGEVSFISPHMDPGKRTARVRVEAPNPDFRLKPGMFARGKVRSRGSEEAPPLTIPMSAPLITGKRAVVYVQLPARDRPTFEGRVVTLGPRMGEHYIVREGLEEGELVVTHGNFKIDSELQIRGRPSMMAPDGDGPPVDRHHGHAAVDPREPPAPADFVDDVPPEFGRQVRAILEGYLDFTEGLAADDLSAALEGLQVMHDALLAVDSDLLPENARVAWDGIYEPLHRDVHRIAEAGTIEGARGQTLQRVTTRVEEAMAGFHAGQMPAVQRAYCPMALDDDGATWLQRGTVVNNPYYGAMMLRCGEIMGTAPGAR